MSGWFGGGFLGNAAASAAKTLAFDAISGGISATYFYICVSLGGAALTSLWKLLFAVIAGVQGAAIPVFRSGNALAYVNAYASNVTCFLYQMMYVWSIFVAAFLFGILNEIWKWQANASDHLEELDKGGEKDAYHIEKGLFDGQMEIYTSLCFLFMLLGIAHLVIAFLSFSFASAFEPAKEEDDDNGYNDYYQDSD